MKNLLKYQNGMSFMGILIIFAMLGCFFLFGLRAFPIYTEYFAMKQSMKAVTNQPYERRDSLTKIRSSLAKNLRINGVYKFDGKNIKEIVKTKKKDGKRYLVVQYDIPNRLFSNLYLSMKIDESVELPKGKSK